MSQWRKVQGDVNDTITVVLSGVEDLSSASGVVAHVWRRGVDKEDLTAAITNPTTRTVVVQLGGAAGWLSDAAPLVWNIEYEVTFGDGSHLTWPSAAPDTIAVRADG